jgi:hypothetical protein
MAGTAPCNSNLRGGRMRCTDLSFVVHGQRQACHLRNTVAGLRVSQVIDEPGQHQVHAHPIRPRSGLQQIGAVSACSHDIAGLGHLLPLSRSIQLRQMNTYEAGAHETNNWRLGLRVARLRPKADVIFKPDCARTVHARQHRRSISTHGHVLSAAVVHARMRQRASVAIVAVHRDFDYGACGVRRVNVSPEKR